MTANDALASSWRGAKLGFEAFDSKEKSLGPFATRAQAAAAISPETPA